MKNLGQFAVGLTFVFATFSSFAQGTVNFNNRIVGTLVTHVYVDNQPRFPRSGNASDDTPSGTTVYDGQLIGGTSTGIYAGQNYTAQLWALAGTGQPASSLQPVTQYTTTFRTQAGGGGSIIPFAPPSDPGIPNTAINNASATVQLRVWDNRGGTVPNWASAQSPTFISGASPTFDLTGLGGGPVNLIGLQSFSLGVAVPEPSTLVLITLGGVWLGLIRRKR